MCLRDAAGEKNPAARFNARDGWDRFFQKEVIQCKITVTVSEVCTSKARATDGTARLVQPRQRSKRPAAPTGVAGFLLFSER